MGDSFRHKGLRKQLVDELIRKGIENTRVLDAINTIPRHLFIDNAFVNFAYKDKAFPIGSNQTISQPYTVAFQTQLLNVQPHEKVLEIGTGSGYQSAVLYLLEADVFTIERQKELFNKTKLFLPTLGYNCKFFYGDGYKGLEKFAKFDKIIITCGAPFVPKDLLNQLKIGGKLIIPLGEKDQFMMRFTRTGPNLFDKEKFGRFRFVPLLENKN